MTNVTYMVREKVAWVTINRPPLNLLSRQTRKEIIEALDCADHDETAHVVVITGTGERAFSAGADVKETPAEMSLTQSLAAGQAVEDFMARIEHSQKPTIAAINGYALGGGFDMAVACTFRIASDTAQMGIVEVNIGLVPTRISCQRLPRLIGLAWATELALTGRKIDAQEAYRIGLVHQVVPPSQLESAAQDFGDMLAQKSPVALSLTLKALRTGEESSARAADLMSAALFHLSSQTPESRQARQAVGRKSS